MKAEKLQNTLDGLTRMMSETQSLPDSDTLNDAWGLLNSHRLEMEAAEAEPDIGSDNPRAQSVDEHLDTIEKRLTHHHRGIAADRNRLDTLESCRGSEITRLNEFGNEFTNKIDAIEKRLDEIPMSFRKALTAHFYDQRERIGVIEKRLTEIERKATMHVHGTAVYLTGG